MENLPNNDAEPSLKEGRLSLAVPESLAGMRLDQCLASLIPEQSRSRLQSLIKGGMVELRGAVCHETKAKVSSGDPLSVEIPSPEAPISAEPEKIPLKVIFESDEMIVIDKPAGMVVHPAAGNWSGTVVNALLGRMPELAGAFEKSVIRPGIVHRLDKDTSGCLLVAKTPDAHFRLSKAFADRKVSKSYAAIVCGWPHSPSRRIEEPIGRHPTDRKRMAVATRAGQGGARDATSIYSTIKRGLIGKVKASFLEVRILTGRTHQIRVHMAHIGNPVAGDSLYGGARRLQASRQMLHAWRLSIPDASGRELSFEAPLPDDFSAILDSMQ